MSLLNDKKEKVFLNIEDIFFALAMTRMEIEDLARNDNIRYIRVGDLMSFLRANAYDLIGN